MEVFSSTASLDQILTVKPIAPPRLGNQHCVRINIIRNDPDLRAEHHARNEDKDVPVTVQEQESCGTVSTDRMRSAG